MNSDFIKLWHSTHSSSDAKHWHSGSADDSIVRPIPDELSIDSLSKMTNPSDILQNVLFHEITIGNNPLASTMRNITRSDGKEFLVPESCGKIIPSADPTDQSFFIKVYQARTAEYEKQDIVPNSCLSVFCPSLGYQIFCMNCQVVRYDTDVKIGNYRAKENIYRMIPEKCIIAYPDSDNINFIEIPFDRMKKA